jgi:hypothetical protein
MAFPVFFAAGAKALPPVEETHKLGERMYRQGLLPSGEPMLAYVKGDVSVNGTSFTCVSCHLRAGIGSVEGGVFTPPTNGRAILQPLKKVHKGVEVKYGESPTRRPAYTDKALAELLVSGIDPTGRVIDDIMPRYLLEDDEMAILIAYLKNLSVKFSPGVTDKEIRFATIYSEGADPVDVELMIKGIDKFISAKNGMSASYSNVRTQRDRLMARAMSTSKELETRKLRLSRWVLKGSPDSWRAQLEDYNRKEPVFAFLGGLVAGPWEPIHRFSEDNGIPCILPNTDLPVISENDWYTLYFSKGFFQEGESAAKFIRSDEALAKLEITQVVRDKPEARALAAGFESVMNEHGQKFHNKNIISTSLANTNELDKLLAEAKSGLLVIWDDSDASALLEAIAVSKNKPTGVFVSGRLLDKQAFALPAGIREFTFMTYPFRLPQDKVIEPMMKKPINFKVSESRVDQQTFALAELLNMAIMEIKGNYYRDNLLDVIGMSMDRVVPLYERLSFGPGQRYASKGCYIVKLTGADKPELVKLSDWVIH